jgi:hypothetical protein
MPAEKKVEENKRVAPSADAKNSLKEDKPKVEKGNVNSLISKWNTK